MELDVNITQQTSAPSQSIERKYDEREMQK